MSASVMLLHGSTFHFHSIPLSLLAGARECFLIWESAQLLMGKRVGGSAELILNQVQLFCLQTTLADIIHTELLLSRKKGSALHFGPAPNTPANTSQFWGVQDLTSLGCMRDSAVICLNKQCGHCHVPFSVSF